MVVSGDATLRANTNDPKIWQLLEDDGVTSIDLTDAAEVHLVFRNQADSVETIFKTSDEPQKLAITGGPTLGKIKFSMALTDFPVAAVYDLYALVVDSSGNISSVPEEKEYTFTVRLLVTA